MHAMYAWFVTDECMLLFTEYVHMCKISKHKETKEV